MKKALRHRWLAAAVVLASIGAFVPGAQAATTEAQASAAAQQGAVWLRSLQDVDGSLGSFGGDWALTALAAAGVNAADVRVDALDPSAQDYYRALWTTNGPGGQATDFERGILTASAAGLEPARLDASTNFVAALAAQFDGHQLGGTGVTNADIFGLLALAAAGAPHVVTDTLAGTLRAQQGADGGWNFASPSVSSDVDMTGAGIAALCSAGVSAQDPAVLAALDFVRAHQDAASGGFTAGFLGLNTNTTAWVLSGLRACGIDPTTWTTAQGKTPLDFLLAQQNADGSFQWQAADGDENLDATQDAVRALAGAAFTAPAPAREDGTSPAVRPAPNVAAGTHVPMTLVIDSGGQVTGGSAVRMCEVSAAVGASVADLLRAALVASAPAYCVSDLALDGSKIVRVNGVVAGDGGAWTVHRDGGASEGDASGPVGLGSLVQLTLTGAAAGGSGGGALTTPPVVVPPLEPAIPKAPAPLRLKLRVGVRTHVTHGRATIALACPRGSGPGGCDAVVRVELRLPAGHPQRMRLHTVGRASAHLRAGTTRRVTVALSKRALRILHSQRAPVATLVASMRDPRIGAITSARATSVLF